VYPGDVSIVLKFSMCTCSLLYFALIDHCIKQWQSERQGTKSLTLRYNIWSRMPSDTFLPLFKSYNFDKRILKSYNKDKKIS
jgi:hypothetical protein